MAHAGKLTEVALEVKAGHGHGQTSVAYVATSDGLALLTCGADGQVCTRDVKSLQVKHTAPPGAAAEPSAVHCLAVDHMRPSIAVGNQQYAKVRELTAARRVGEICVRAEHLTSANARL